MRDGWRCAYCKCTGELTLDHFVPLSKGGTNTLGNLRLACAKCNNDKRDTDPREQNP